MLNRFDDGLLHTKQLFKYSDSFLLSHPEKAERPFSARLNSSSRRRTHQWTTVTCYVILDVSHGQQKMPRTAAGLVPKRLLSMPFSSRTPSPECLERTSPGTNSIVKYSCIIRLLTSCIGLTREFSDNLLVSPAGVWNPVSFRFIQNLQRSLRRVAPSLLT